jgi:hypothetical protein
MAKSKPKLGSYFHPTTYANNHASREIKYEILGEIQDLEETFDRQLSHLRNKGAVAPPSAAPATALAVAPPSKSTWTGKISDLAREVKANFESGKMPWVPTLTAALCWALKDGYELTNGRTSTHESLAAILYRDKKREEGNVEYC